MREAVTGCCLIRDEGCNVGTAGNTATGGFVVSLSRSAEYNNNNSNNNNNSRPAFSSFLYCCAYVLFIFIWLCCAAAAASSAAVDDYNKSRERRRIKNDEEWTQCCPLVCNNRLLLSGRVDWYQLAARHNYFRLAITLPSCRRFRLHLASLWSRMWCKCDAVHRQCIGQANNRQWKEEKKKFPGRRRGRL